MRKFRAWDKQKDMQRYLPLMFLDQLYLRQDGEVVWHSHLGLKIVTELFDIEFSTGLFDKNGTEIYEGDIVKMPSGRMHRSTLEVKWGGVWDYAGFGLHAKRKDRGKDNWETEYSWDALNPATGRACEVVGNVFENEDMVKEINGNQVAKN